MMMIEWLMVPALIGVAALVPTGNQDKGKINTIFENVGYGIKKKDGKLDKPRFRKKLSIVDGEEQIGTRYLYQIPLGLPATKLAEMEKNVGIFTDGLNRPVIVEFKVSIEKDPRKYLTISVFNKDIPNLYPYAKVPKQKPLNEGTDKEFMQWLIPLGRTLKETIWHDFDKVPHMTVAGTTRFGKTVFLKVLVTYLIEHHPDDVELFIIDLKGGLEFGRYETLKQVKGVASNPVEAVAMLQNIHEQLQEQYKIFRKNFWTNVTNTPIKTRRFIIVDEAAQLAPEKWMGKEEKDLLGACQWILGEITRIGGGIGYREIFCTQY
jgi:DNA segregation ATPase FtsK/SpoIIIE, S-DNA-T family